MKIGIDIDNTICKTSLLIQRIYNKIKADDYKLLSKDKQYEFSAKYEKEIFDDCPLEENAKEVINGLYDSVY